MDQESNPPAPPNLPTEGSGVDLDALERVARCWSGETYQNVMLPGPLTTCGQIGPTVLRLLSARRELLAALKDARGSILLWIGDVECGLTPTVGSLQNALDEVRSAVAQAEARS